MLPIPVSSQYLMKREREEREKSGARDEGSHPKMSRKKRKVEHATALKGFWIALCWGKESLGISEDSGRRKTPAIPVWVAALPPSLRWPLRVRGGLCYENGFLGGKGVGI